ncbi:hypothetical protein SNK04_005891 [Fusarium graminearum]
MWSALSQGFSAVREICNIYAFPVVSVELSFGKFTWHAKTRVSHRHDSRLNKDDQFAFLFAQNSDISVGGLEQNRPPTLFDSVKGSVLLCSTPEFLVQANQIGMAGDMEEKGQSLLT